MKFLQRLVLPCAAALLILLSGCASTASQEGTGEYIDDTVISTKVRAAITADRPKNAVEISVETFKGVVQLSGFVSTRADMDRAVEVAGGITGVKRVKNAMAVKGGQ